MQGRLQNILKIISPDQDRNPSHLKSRCLRTNKSLNLSELVTLADLSKSFHLLRRRKTRIWFSMQVYCQWILTLQWWSNNKAITVRQMKILFLETALCMEITENSFGWWCMKIILKGLFEGVQLKKRSRDKACGVVVIS